MSPRSGGSISGCISGRCSGDIMQGNSGVVGNNLLRLCNSRFLKFCIVGGSGVIVNMGLLWLLTEIAGLYYLISSAISIETSIVTNFILNDYWTWKDVGGDGFKERLYRAVKFNIICAAGLVINISILWAMTEILGIYYLASNLFGIAGAMLWNFYVNDKVTWKD